MEWIDYREKLGISFWDEKKASFFIAQLLNSLDDFLRTESTAGIYMRLLILMLFPMLNTTVSAR